ISSFSYNWKPAVKSIDDTQANRTGKTKYVCCRQQIKFSRTIYRTHLVNVRARNLLQKAIRVRTREDQTDVRSIHVGVCSHQMVQSLPLLKSSDTNNVLARRNSPFCQDLIPSLGRQAGITGTKGVIGNER